MLFRFFITLVGLSVLAFESLQSANVGLLVMATGKYVAFVEPLVASANKHFCKNHHVTYFVFTDGETKPLPNVVYIYQPRLGWPYDTMMRFQVYYDNRDLLKGQDFLYACDADMLFVANVGDEIFGKRVATIHPGFYNQRGSYETNPRSKACVWPNEGAYYFCGGFYGGIAAEFLQIAKVNAGNIAEDLSKGIIAVWHDESHWNRYCIDHKPTVVLSPSYCYPESWNLPFPKKLLALDKNHHEIRG